jgi:hypothetical protein
MGAVVELFGAEAFPLLTAFTDIHGHYQFSNLAPGHYSVRVLQAYSMPAHRQNILVNSNTHAIINLTLASLFGVAQWFPAVPRSADAPADDWTWTLRSGVDRPILRWTDDLSGRRPDQDDDTIAERDPAHPDPAHPVSVHASLYGGSTQFGEGGFRQEALIRASTSEAGDGILHFQTSTSGEAFVAGGIQRNLGPGDTARAVAMYRTLPIDDGTGQGRLQVLQVRGGEQMALSDQLLAQFGVEGEGAWAKQNVAAAHPFVAVHLMEAGNEISYRLATSSDLQEVADLASEGGIPAVSMGNGKLRLARSLHQELSVQRKFAGMQLEAAYYYDHLVDPVLNGYGDGSATEFSSGEVLLDPDTGAFRTAGPKYSGGGFRVFATRQLRGNVWTAVEFAEGPAITLPATRLLGGPSFNDALTGIETTRTQSVLFSMQGHIPHSGTRWNAGYRWQPEATISSVDSFNTGLSAPFLSVALHQPLGSGNSSNSSTERLELEFVMQNMLAQGYRPIYVVAGQTLFFAQAPRLVTGGLAFSF